MIPPKKTALNLRSKRRTLLTKNNDNLRLSFYKILEERKMDKLKIDEHSQQIKQYQKEAEDKIEQEYMDKIRLVEYKIAR